MCLHEKTAIMEISEVLCIHMWLYAVQMRYNHINNYIIAVQSMLYMLEAIEGVCYLVLRF